MKKSLDFKQKSQRTNAIGHPIRAVLKFDFRNDMNGKSAKFGILLLLIYIIYLAIGAAVFMVLETPNEVRLTRFMWHGSGNGGSTFALA